MSPSLPVLLMFLVVVQIYGVTFGSRVIKVLFTVIVLFKSNSTQQTAQLFKVEAHWCCQIEYIYSSPPSLHSTAHIFIISILFSLKVYSFKEFFASMSCPCLFVQSVVQYNAQLLFVYAALEEV